MEYYSSLRKNEVLLFATTGMDLESTVLSKISPRTTNTLDFTRVI